VSKSTLQLVRATGYQLGLANDQPGRDPVQWQLSGSVDGVRWDLLDDRSTDSQKVTVPVTRSRLLPKIAFQRFYESGDLSMPA
jgi:hypothetical protein